MPAGPTFEPIATATLASTTGSITFSDIPQTYTDLRVVAVLRQVTAYNDTRITFNGSTTDYSITRMGVDAANALFGIAPINNTNGIWQNQNSVGAEDADPALFACSITDVFSYTSSYNKTALTKTFCALDNQTPQFGAGTWMNTSAITSLSVRFPGAVTTQFSIGSTVTLYGIKAA